MLKWIEQYILHQFLQICTLGFVIQQSVLFVSHTQRVYEEFGVIFHIVRLVACRLLLDECLVKLPRLLRVSRIVQCLRRCSLRCLLQSYILSRMDRNAFFCCSRISIWCHWYPFSLLNTWFHVTLTRIFLPSLELR